MMAQKTIALGMAAFPRNPTSCEHCCGCRFSIFLSLRTIFDVKGHSSIYVS